MSRRLGVVALASLAGLVVTIGLYSRYPLPASFDSPSDPGIWISIALLALGLVCFLALLISGLITILNWIGGRARDRGD